MKFINIVFVFFLSKLMIRIYLVLVVITFTINATTKDRYYSNLMNDRYSFLNDSIEKTPEILRLKKQKKIYDESITKYSLGISERWGNKNYTINELDSISIISSKEDAIFEIQQIKSSTLNKLIEEELNRNRKEIINDSKYVKLKTMASKEEVGWLSLILSSVFILSLRPVFLKIFIKNEFILSSRDKMILVIQKGITRYIDTAILLLIVTWIIYSFGGSNIIASLLFLLFGVMLVYIRHYKGDE